jgi:anthranilate 1,2-dioxygenase small subunit
MTLILTDSMENSTMGNASSNTSSSIQNDLQLQSELRNFYEQYTACLDDCNFDRWLNFFTSDGNYRITSRENYARGLPLAAMSCVGKDRVTALVKVLVYEPRIWRRFVSSVRVDKVEGDVIHARANFLLFESMMDREPQLNMLGEYIDKIVRLDDGSYRFKDRSCVYDNYRIQTTLFAPA